MRINAQIAKRPRIEMVPLIDMFFLLLVFFIFGVFSMRLQEGITVDLPGAATAVFQQDQQTITLSLTEDGALFVNQEPVSDAELVARLQQAQERQPNVLVVLNADRAVPHGRVITLLDSVRQAGLRRVSFQAIPQTRGAP